MTVATPLPVVRLILLFALSVCTALPAYGQTRTLRPVSSENYGITLKIPVTFGFYDYAFDEAARGFDQEGLDMDNRRDTGQGG